MRTRFYYALRIYLHKKRGLLRLVQILRAYIVLGPLRKPMILYYQKVNKNDPIKTDTHPIFPDAIQDQIVKRLDDVGYAHMGKLPEKYITQILEYCEADKLRHYWNPHKNCEAVNRLCRNSKIVGIARQYLGAEPILWLSQMKWSLPLDDDFSNSHASIYREPIQYDGYSFHYDVLDFKSLTLFVYLTDVDADSGAHMTIERTSNKTLKEIYKIILNEDTAQRKFGDRIKVISGKKGTAFFEETSSYHKVTVCKKRRLILSIDYVLQRKPPPERPLLPS